MSSPSTMRQYAIALAIVVGCTIANTVLGSWLAATDEAMVYLLGVVLASVYFDRRVSIACAVVSFIAFDFLFVPPTLTLRFGSTQYLLTGSMLLIVGCITSALAARVRTEASAVAAAAVSANEERLRNVLLASLSHDLRTPLAVIAGSASSLKDHRERLSLAEQDQLLQTIFDRSVRMSVEVTDLLEMTRLHTGCVTPDRQWYPIEELIGAALERCRGTMQGHPLSVQTPNEVCLVYVDGVLIEKLFVNLLENAALHTPPTTPIRIFAKRSSGKLRVYVQDDGPGLPPGGERRIFEKFERGERLELSAGSGLGLSICQAIAELHGIEITARNHEQGGAEFVVTFDTGDTEAAALS